MKTNLISTGLAVPLLLLCAWPRTSVAQAAISYAVVAWGYNWYGQTTIPVAVQSGAIAIAAGGFHTVALKNDGSVVAWGENAYGQTTVPLAAQSGVTAIAAGTFHTVALKNDGSVVAWGWNGFGQVAGTNVPYSAIASPVTLEGQVLSGVIAIAAGGAHTVALKTDGTVVAWGHNQYGQTTVPLAARNGVAAIAAGGQHTVALKDDGAVVAWGYNEYGQTTVPVAAQSGVVAIAAGSFHTVALKSDGSVVAWGYNDYGQTTVPLAAQSGVTAIAAGDDHTVALKNDGSVAAWGVNDSGQVTGTPSTEAPYSAIASPITLEGQVLSGVTAIAAGGLHTVALVIPTPPNITTQPEGQAVNVWQSASFTVVATGYPLNYQWRKDGVDLAGATNATYYLPFAQTNDAGSYTVVVSKPRGSVTSAPPAVLTVNPVAAPGTVVGWGGNEYGQTTVPVAAQSGVTAIAAGGHCGLPCVFGHTVALKNDGSVIAWGDNAFGQTTVPLAAQSGVIAIAAGVWHTVALKNDGSVAAWGNNGNGQVTGTPTDPYFAIASPVTLEGQILSGVTAIAAGGWHTVALKNDGSVVSWGTLDQTTVPLAAQSGVTAIAAGESHTVALKSDGSVLSWGSLDQTTVPLAAQSGVTAIAAGYRHTMALKNDGTLVAWGDNYYGQVTGTPTTDYPYSAIASPVTLEGQVLSGVRAIAAGGWHTLALKNDGTLVAWGDNYYGQVTGTPTTDYPYSAIASPVTPGGQILSGVTAIAAGINHTVALIGGVDLLPSLNARPNGNELILSWPTNAVGFTLQSTLDLTPPVIWLDSTRVPAVIGAHFTVTNTTSSGARFYRLRKM